MSIIKKIVKASQNIGFFKGYLIGMGIMLVLPKNVF